MSNRQLSIRGCGIQLRIDSSKKGPPQVNRSCILALYFALIIACNISKYYHYPYYNITINPNTALIISYSEYRYVCFFLHPLYIAITGGSAVE